MITFSTNHYDNLKNILIFIRKNNIKVWIDSGTLLGLRRNGRFIDGDNDIDLSILIETKVQDDFILDNVANLKEVRSIRYYCGSIYKIKFSVAGFSYDIQLFRPKKAHYIVSPQHFLPKDYIKKSIVLHLLAKFKKVSLNKLIKLNLVNLGHWVYPLSHFANLSENIDALSDFFPIDTDEYLTYRYGDWHVEMSAWSSEIDDNGLILT